MLSRRQLHDSLLAYQLLGIPETPQFYAMLGRFADNRDFA
jgi:hypothetical protein